MRSAPPTGGRAGAAVLLTVSALCAALGSTRARAQCTERALSVGVALEQCSRASLRWAVVRADLGAVDVGVRVTRPSERAQSAPEWAGDVDGALVVAQAGPFEFPSYEPTGLTVGRGAAWDGTQDDGLHAVLALDERNVGLVANPERIVALEEWMANVLSGPMVLRDGTPVEPCRGEGCDVRPRTAVGLSEDGRRLVILVVQGWSEDSEGVTDPMLGQMAAEAGAADALRTGDGATSALWDAEEAAVIPSSDGAFRPAAAWLAIGDRSSGERVAVKGVVGEEGDPESRLPGARVVIETLDGVEVAETTRVSSTGFYEHTIPQREYIVRGSLDGYRTACTYCPALTPGDKWCSVFLAPGDGKDECAPPPRRVDAGPWPRADGGTLADGGADAGPRPDAGGGGGSGGCRVAVDPRRRQSGGACLVLALAWVRWRRHRGTGGRKKK